MEILTSQPHQAHAVQEQEISRTARQLRCEVVTAPASHTATEREHMHKQWSAEDIAAHERAVADWEMDGGYCPPE